MNRSLLFTAVLVPNVTMAAVCDMSDFKRIDQNLIDSAPSCIASRDYSSVSCARVRELTLESFQASASIKAIGCEDLPYEEDPRLEPLQKQILALKNAYHEKDRTSKKVTTQRDTNSPPEINSGVEVCTKLMEDIKSKNDFSEIQLLENKTDMSSFYPIMPCTYEAVRPTVYGNTRKIIKATLNLSNNRYRIQMH